MSNACRSLLLSLCLPLLATASLAGTLQPTPEQIEAYGSIDSSQEVAFVKAYRVRDEAEHRAFLAESAAWVKRLQGRRVYVGSLEGRESGFPGMGFDTLVIDEFPDRMEALMAYNQTLALHPRAHADVRILVVRPGSRWIRLSRWLARLASALAGPDIREAAPLPRLPGEEGEAVKAMEKLLSGPHEHEPLAMLNFNAYRKRAQYPENTPPEEADVSGEEAYRRYARNAMWQVFRRGGYALWAGKAEMLLVGPADDVWATPWDDVALVVWPSRLELRDMLSDPDYQKGFHHRSAGIARSLVVPGTPWPAFRQER